MNFKNSFIDLAKEYGKSIEVGDHKNSNKQHKKLTKLYKSESINHINDLKELTLDTDPYVRLWASTFLLKYEEKFAINNLEKIASLPGIVGLSASTTLDLWKSNMLNLL